MLSVAEQELKMGAFGSDLPDRLRELVVGLDHSTSPDGFAPLHWACYHGRAEVLQPLLEEGANVAITTKLDWTAAHICAIRGMDSCLKVLLSLSSDLDVTAKDKRGYSSAHLAAIHGHHKTLQLLIEAGVDVNEQDGKGWSLLHHAAYHGRLAVVELLLGEQTDPTDAADCTVDREDEQKANLDVRNVDGNTPFHLAAAEGHLDCLKLMMGHVQSPKAECKCHNKMGQTPKHLAVKYQKQDCVDFLTTAEKTKKSSPLPRSPSHAHCPPSHHQGSGDNGKEPSCASCSNTSFEQLSNSEISGASKSENGVGPSQTGSDTKRQLEGLAEQLGEERERREALESEVEELRSQLNTTKRQLDSLKRKKKPSLLTCGTDFSTESKTTLEKQDRRGILLDQLMCSPLPPH